MVLASCGGVDNAQKDTLHHVGKHVLVVANEEGVPHEGQFFRVLVGKFYRGGDGVGHNVVHEGGTACARVAQPHHLGSREVEVVILGDFECNTSTLYMNTKNHN